MKVNAKQYARGLHEMVAGKKKEEVEKVITDFINFVARQRDFKKIDEIIFELDKILQKENDEIKVDLTSARHLSKEAMEYLKIYLAKKSGSEKITISENIDPKILGGFIVRYGDKVIDGSVKQNLLYFQKQLSN